MRRSRKPLSVVRRIEGSNPSPSAFSCRLENRLGRARPAGELGGASGAKRRGDAELAAPPRRVRRRLAPVRLALPVGLAVVALAAAGCGDGNDEAAGLPKLIGTVGSPDDPDAYEIHLTTEDGAEVTTVLPPGEYRLEINDLSTIHNFHLAARREGVDVATEVPGTGRKTSIVRLQEPEAYIYFCDAHPDRMQVTFSIHDRIRTQN